MNNLISTKLAAVGIILFTATTAFAADQKVIRIDGSSTVYPLTEAVAEEFGSTNKDTKLLVGISGTGGGFKKFCAGEIDISDASRPIKQVEIEACNLNGISFIELPIAYDALTVVVNKNNSWISSLSIAELKTIWAPEAQGKITKWSQVNPTWPDKPLTLFGPGVDSGTYDYFTEMVVGKEHSSRGDFTSSEDDNVLVQGVNTDSNALGFFGMAYFVENTDKLKAVAIDNGTGGGPVAPSAENVINGKYKPLSRPLFIYIQTRALDKPEVKQFVSYYLEHISALAQEIGYVPLSQNSADIIKSRYTKGRTGSLYREPADHKLSLEQLLAR